MPEEERKEPSLQLSPLATGEVQVKGWLTYASNRVFLVECCLSAGAPVLAVYKPAAGSRPLYDFTAASLPGRETAAHLVSEMLGWGLVPPTVFRDDLPHGPGSLQLFIDHDPEQHYFTLRQGRDDVFKRMALFDVLTNNADRKAGHCLLDPAGRIWAIDNGLTFHVEPKLRTVIWDFAGRRIAPAHREEFRRLSGLLEHSDLNGLLSHAEMEALRQRAELLARPGKYPEPSSDWSFPWPLV